MLDKSLIGSLQRTFLGSGFRSERAAFIAGFIIAAWNEDRTSKDLRVLFTGMAAQLECNDHGDALSAAQDWLQDPGLSAREWETCQNALRVLEDHRGPIDWTAEVDQFLSFSQGNGRTFGLSLALSKAMDRVLDLPLTDSIACLYTPSAALAWQLSTDRAVTLFADRDIGIILALFARAACRELHVKRQNPIDGSFMPGALDYESVDREPPFVAFDHIVSIPPFGMRISEGPAKGMPFEAYHIERLFERARKTFTAIVPDGFLFRDTKGESEIRHRLIKQRQVTVMSLPAGMFAHAGGVATSILHLENERSDTALMIDGRSRQKGGPRKAHETIIVKHLEDFRGLRPKDEERMDQVYVDELAANRWSLLPDRYVTSSDLARIDEALGERETVELQEVASIERNKAALPIRDAFEDPPLIALEIAPMDVADGLVAIPTKQQAYETDQKVRVEGITAQADDILVSIKGNIGRVGMVGDGAVLANVMKEPWVISQSLAIVRWQPNDLLPSPAILNAILTAPWVREKLESMSGGTTVKSLPITALRSLRIPVPTREECAAAEEQLKEIEELREIIANQQSNLAEKKETIWSQLWQVPIISGES
jgi:type I restriction-modification system DNA methylase subunit